MLFTLKLSVFSSPLDPTLSVFLRGPGPGATTSLVLWTSFKYSSVLGSHGLADCWNISDICHGEVGKKTPWFLWSVLDFHGTWRLGELSWDLHKSNLAGDWGHHLFHWGHHLFGSECCGSHLWKQEIPKLKALAELNFGKTTSGDGNWRFCWNNGQYPQKNGRETNSWNLQSSKWLGNPRTPAKFYGTLSALKKSSNMRDFPATFDYRRAQGPEFCPRSSRKRSLLQGMRILTTTIHGNMLQDLPRAAHEYLMCNA